MVHFHFMDEGHSSENTKARWFDKYGTDNVALPTKSSTKCPRRWRSSLSSFRLFINYRLRQSRLVSQWLYLLWFALSPMGIGRCWASLDLNQLVRSVILASHPQAAKSAYECVLIITALWLPHLEAVRCNSSKLTSTPLIRKKNHIKMARRHVWPALKYCVKGPKKLNTYTILHQLALLCMRPKHLTRRLG